jgi:putative DNA primase/helicase
MQDVEDRRQHQLDCMDALKQKHKFAIFSANGVLYHYDDQEGIWKSDGEEFVLTFINMFYQAIKQEATNGDASEILGWVKREFYLPLEKFISPENKICVLNGVLDLKTLTLEPFNSDYYFLKKLPICFDKLAICPKIDKFLSEVLKDENDVKAMHEWVGYHLTKGQKFQKSSLWIGIGKNGKTKLGELLRTFFGKEATVSLTLEELCNDKFASAGLFDKIANIGSELPRGRLKDTEIFKKLVGGDSISGQQKFKDRFEFHNDAKLTFYGNEFPVLKNVNDTFAFFRRFLIWEFPNIFNGEKEDKNILEKISTPEELSGMLNRAIEGLNRLEQNQKFSNEKPWEEIRSNYILLSNLELAFIDSEIEQDEDIYILTDDCFEAYKTFCKKHNKQPSSKSTLSNKIQESTSGKIAFRKVNDKTVRVYEGIKLKNSTALEHTEEKPLEEFSA